MKFLLQRLFFTTGRVTGDFTCGFVSNVEDSYKAFVLEDTYRKTKIAKETRVPAGLYELKFRAEDTKLTIKHRESYNKPGDEWFKYHIEVTGIPNYIGVYVHSGVDDKHTEGCLLFMYGFNMGAADNQGSDSLIAVKRFYQIVRPLLEAGERCFIEIRDEQIHKL